MERSSGLNLKRSLSTRETFFTPARLTTIFLKQTDAGFYPAPAPLGDTLHLKAVWDQGEKNETTLTIAGFSLKIDTLNRTVSFGEKIAPLPGSDGKISLEILLDRLSMEVFINQGEVYMPLYLSPDERSKEYGMEVKGDALNLESMTVWPLKSIWEQDSGR